MVSCRSAYTSELSGNCRRFGPQAAVRRCPGKQSVLVWRKEDLAFEQPVGDNPRHRHHVRFWRTDEFDEDGRPVWVGSAIYDKKVGLSRTTGQITHVTAPDIDAERDFLFHCLEQTGDLSETYVLDDFHKVRKGRNGGGDPWETDGRLFVGIILAGEKLETAVEQSIGTISA